MNLEIILVDDGSPDNCGAICDDWARKDTRIHVIHQENMGLSGARNAGIEQSNGRYLMFVDSDDYVESEYVERLYQSIKTHQADIAISGFSYLDEEKNVREAVWASQGTEVLDRIGACLGLESNGDNKIIYTVVWSKLYKRELWEDMRFREGVLCEDEYIMPYLYEKSSRVALVKECLYVYRKRKGSITAEQNAYFREAQVGFRVEREELYRRIGSKELLMLQQIHLYSVYCDYKMLDDSKYKEIQKKIRKYYFTEKYMTSISVVRRLKDLLAVISLSLYQRLVDMNQKRYQA